MAFPATIDNLTNPASTDKLNSPSHADQHINANNAIELAETKIGIDDSSDATSLDYLIKNTSSSNPGHKHTLANGATDVMASKDELNILDGVVSNTTELNLLSGVTATTSELNLTDGLGDAWTAFTPSWTNLTVGSGTNVGAYKRIGKLVIGWIKFIYGAGSSMGAASVALPVSLASGFAGMAMPIGTIIINDYGTGFFCGSLLATGSLYVRTSNATYVGHSSLASNEPMTWQTTDELFINFMYEGS
jgi:hypothetical protein